MLCYLAERPGILVPKEELFSQLWASTAVTDDSLTKSIREIRDALGDDAKAPRFVATVHRRGFRFVAETHRQSTAESGESAAGERDPGDEQPATDFVGRVRELQQLRAGFRRACSGQRHIVFVTGEPGIGKTALVEAFVSSLSTQHATLLVGHGCSVEQAGAREAYMPILAALEGIAHDPQVGDLVPLLRRFAPTWLAQVPWLTEGGHTETLVQSLVDTTPARMLREFCAFAEALTKHHTLVLVLEDLHWSDPATVDLLVMLAQRREPARLLVLGTYRRADAAAREPLLLQAMQTLRVRRQCTEIPLHYLTGLDVAAYVERHLPGYDRPQELAQLLYEHTEGSPLFMTAVLEDLIARGWLVETAPGWALTVPFVKADLGVPEDLRQMITTQLHAMNPGDQALLEVASVAGVDFTAHTIAAGCQLTIEEAESACERLSRVHRFVRVKGATQRPEGGMSRCYGFLHTLYRQVVYEAMPEGRRRRLHQRVGEGIEAAYGDRAADIAAELSVHFERSGDAIRAVKYLAEAAVRVQRRFAPREAIAYLERAIEIATRLPESQSRRRQEIALHSLLSSALGSLHGYASEPAWRSYEHVRTLCEEAGSPEDQYRALYALWHSQAARAEPRLVDTADRMVQLAAMRASPAMRAQAGVVLGRTRFWQGKFVEAHDVLQGTLEFWDHQPGSMEGPALLEPPGIAAYFYRGVVLWFLGYPEQGQESVREAVAVAEPVAHPFVRAGTLLHAAYITHLWRDHRAVERLAQRTIEMAEEHEFPFWKAMATALLGWALAQHGAAERGAALIREGLALHRTSGARTISSHMLGFLADACLRLADTTAGLQAAEEGLTLVESTCDRVYEAELWRLKGELLLAHSKGRSSKSSARKARAHHPDADAQSRAEACFHRALNIARTQEAKSFELRAATSLALLWRDQSKSAAAREMLAPLYAWFTEGFDTGDLREAKAILDGPA